MHLFLKKILGADSVTSLQSILSKESTVVKGSLREYLKKSGKECFIFSRIDGGEDSGIRVFMSKNGDNHEISKFYYRDEIQYMCDLYGESTSIIGCTNCGTIIIPEKLPETYLMLYFEYRYIVVDLKTKLET